MPSRKFDGETMARHILVGPGKFGLGFAGDLFARVGQLQTVIISRSASAQSRKTSTDSVLRDVRIASNKSYRVRYDGKDYRAVEGIELLQCNFLAPTDDVISEFAKEELEIVTVSVTETGLDDVAVLLARGIEARIKALPERKLPLVLAFVNTPNNGKKLLASICENVSELAAVVIRQNDGFLPDCVIDRICSSLEIDANGLVTVDVEKYASVLLIQSAYTACLRTLSVDWQKAFGRAVLREVSNLENFKAWSALKHWGLNGLHLLLASVARTPIYSRYDPEADADVSLSDVLSDPSVKSLVEGFVSEVSLAVRSKYPGEITRDDARSFLVSATQRVSLKGDTVDRMLMSLRLDAANVAQHITSKPVMFGDKDWIEEWSGTIVNWCLGEFLNKVDTRLLSPTFHLSGKERVHPVNLAIGTSSVLYAITDHMRKKNV